MFTADVTVFTEIGRAPMHEILPSATLKPLFTTKI